MTSASTILILFLAVIVIGPSKLPAGAESIWLAMTNLSNAQRGLPELSLETARRMWKVNRSPLYSIINLLYAAAEHLEELRRRLAVTGVVFLIAVIIAGVFASDLLEALRVPAGDIDLIFIRPPEMFMAYFNVVVTAGILVTLPVALYEILLFIGPAFESDSEKKGMRLFRWLAFPAVLILFASGVVFAYLVLLPVALEYFATFGGDAATAQWTISAYLKFVLNILIGLGAAFEMPLFILLLARFGIVTSDTLRRGWRIAFVVTAIIAAVITPTPDPLNMSMVWLPLFGLYLLGVLLAMVFGKKPEPAG
ncbi:MAG: twin-arginine translocase subunit TatC [Ardenticatenales bacterium]|nr:twin-arginine translocase subunit TatC [Ardenticatenales bacterium]